MRLVLFCEGPSDQRTAAALVDPRVPQGHFDGQPAAPDALMARTVFTLARRTFKGAEAVDAVVFVRDMDDQGDARRKGLAQARAEAEPISPFHIVIGCADPMREAWVLAGFEPESDDERARLDDLRRELGFSPCDEAHRLDAKDERAKRSAKRVADALTSRDSLREARSWTHTPLAQLRTRGAATGLASFLDEVKRELVPLCGGAPSVTA